MSQQHFVRNLLELNAKCPKDHMRHFDSVVSGKRKKIIYYNRSYVMIVTMNDKEQESVRITIRAPSHSLAAEKGEIERRLGVKTCEHYANV